MYVYLIAHIPGFQNTVIYKFGGNMSRNKYPERTVERILKTSYLLFTKKGYDNVSIQDIVDELGDVTKGAIYHHFKSKDDILAEIFHRLCKEYSLERLLQKHPDLNALEKVKASFKDTFNDKETLKINLETIPLIHNPHFFTSSVKTVLKSFSPQLEVLIQQGIEDGSMSVNPEYVKETAEVFSLLTRIWILPTLIDNSKEEAFKKIDMIKIVLDGIGIPVFDDEILEMAKRYIQKFYLPG